MYGMYEIAEFDPSTYASLGGATPVQSILYVCGTCTCVAPPNLEMRRVIPTPKRSTLACLSELIEVLKRHTPILLVLEVCVFCKQTRRWCPPTHLSIAMNSLALFRSHCLTTIARRRKLYLSLECSIHSVTTGLDIFS